MTGPATRDSIAEQRHAELIEQIRRLNVGVETLVQGQDRTNRHLAELGAKTESLLQYAVRLWRGESASPRR